MPSALFLRDRLIVALDLPSVEMARDMIARLDDAVSFYKIGYRLAFSGGLDLIETLKASGKKVFVDLKLHDIGNTVREGVEALARRDIDLLTVHAYPQTMRAAVEGRGNSSMKLLAVTILTSYDQADCVEAGYTGTIAELVERRSRQAIEIGCDGLVCSPLEATRVRGVVGATPLIVTPGVRPAQGERGDQKRAKTPSQALQAGASHLVVGRPIIGAPNPYAAAVAIVEEMTSF